MMDPRLSAALKSALAVWLDSAMEEMREHAAQVAALRKAMWDNSGDVRISYHIRRNAISIETFDADEEVGIELFREQLVPDNPPSESKH